MVLRLQKIHDMHKSEMAKDSRRVPLGTSQNDEFHSSGEGNGVLDNNETSTVPEDIGVFDDTNSQQSTKTDKKTEGMFFVEISSVPHVELR